MPCQGRGTSRTDGPVQGEQCMGWDILDKVEERLGELHGRSRETEEKGGESQRKGE